MHVDDRHCQHAPDSLFSILVPCKPLHIPFTQEGVIAGFGTRPPTQQELVDDTTSHLELTSDVEWIPGTFALSLPEEEETNSVNERRICRYESSAREGSKLQGDQVPNQELFTVLIGDPILIRDPASKRGECDELG